MRTQAKVAAAVGFAVASAVLYGFSRIMDPLTLRGLLMAAAFVFPIFGIGGWCIGWLIGEPFDRQRRDEKRAAERARALARANRGRFNGWARIAMIFVFIGACLTAVAALWAYGLMNHAGRQYGWWLVAALGFATYVLFQIIRQDPSNCAPVNLIIDLAICYAISSVGGAVAGGFAERDLFTGLALGGALLAPLFVLGVVVWVVDGFRRGPAPSQRR